MEKVIFLSHVLDGRAPLYGGAKGLSFKRVREIKKGDSCNAMHWSFGNHAGTHVDVPRHFIDRGKIVDQFSAATWLFDDVKLLTLKGVRPGQVIMPEDMGALSTGTDLLLIKTGFERWRGRALYWQNAPGLHPRLAGWLRRQCPRIRAVGMDVISVSSLPNRELGREAHREFLGRNILLLEDMKLSFLKRSPSKVLVAPLRVRDGDAAPCTIFAWSRS